MPASRPADNITVLRNRILIFVISRIARTTKKWFYHRDDVGVSWRSEVTRHHVSCDKKCGG